MLAVLKEVPVRMDTLIPVVAAISSHKVCLVPISIHSLERKTMFDGATSSCRVHPRLNHLLFANAAFCLSVPVVAGTSAR